MEKLPEALAAMRAYHQFLLWKAVPSKRRPGKVDKFPCDVSGKIVDAHNPDVWVDSETACSVAGILGDNYGVGFVFTQNDPFFFVDIDGAWDGKSWSPIATDLCTSLSGAAVEVSQSNTGLHIIGQYNGVAPDHGCKNIPMHLELYTEGRFVALTGTSASGSAGLECTTALTDVIARYYPANTGDVVTAAEWSTIPHADSVPILDDVKLIEKACSHTGVDFGFGKVKATFNDLWTCNVEALRDSYPDEIREYDASSADAALAQHLAFWTGNQCDRIESLMRQSALVRRKWDYHKSYMSRTILGATSRQTTWYNKTVSKDTVIVDPIESVLPVALLRTGYQMLSSSEQVRHFDKCVYIAEIDRIFTPNGATLKSAQFKSMYGGYNFAMDDTGDKVTKDAWEAFTQSQVAHFPKADASCFRPKLDSGSIVKINGWRFANTYVPIEVNTIEGDVTPFNEHLAKVLPDARDRSILLSYMAACIQYKGYKIQWAPLLQGVVGNGKTLFTRCVAYAIGERYVHMPPALEISEKFNSWLFGNLFIGVEDVYVPDNKQEMLEALKPMITNKRMARRAMNTDQVMDDVCCNFMFNSNHKDAIKDAVKDRRYCVFYSAQQDKIDLVRDGMGGDYFQKLYEWLDDCGGYAMVAHMLENFDIPAEFNPTLTCQTAPDTSSKAEAVNVSMGGVEQEVLEAIDEGRRGFSNGWVSSFALDKLINEMRKGNQIPINKRRELMKSLGFDWHPGLKQGRVNNPIMMEDGKPRLFIKHGHIHANLTSGAEIVRQYCSAQGDLLSIGVDSSVKKV